MATPLQTIVGVYQLAAYSSSSNFLKPDFFVPERWLHLDGSNDIGSDDKDVFQPFSMGPKNCIGKTLAYAEMKLILSRFLWHFDFSVLDKDFSFEKQRVFLFRQKPPLRLHLKVRQR